VDWETDKSAVLRMLKDNGVEFTELPPNAEYVNSIELSIQGPINLNNFSGKFCKKCRNCKVPKEDGDCELADMHYAIYLDFNAVGDFMGTHMVVYP